MVLSGFTPSDLDDGRSRSGLTDITRADRSGDAQCGIAKECAGTYGDGMGTCRGAVFC